MWLCIHRHSSGISNMSHFVLYDSKQQLNVSFWHRRWHWSEDYLQVLKEIWKINRLWWTEVEWMNRKEVYNFHIRYQHECVWKCSYVYSHIICMCACASVDLANNIIWRNRTDFLYNIIAVIIIIINNVVVYLYTCNRMKILSIIFFLVCMFQFVNVI